MLGACAGSLLNLCVDRWPGGASVLSPRSRCDGRAAPFDWRGLVPVVGHLAAGGRCGRRRTRRSLRYPLVELTAALLWALVFARLGATAEAARAVLFLTILLAVAVSDARTYIIPDQLTLGGAALGVLLAPLAGGIGVGEAVVGAALGFGMLWIVALGAKAALGEGGARRRRRQDDGDGRRLPRPGDGPAGALHRRAPRFGYLWPRVAEDRQAGTVRRVPRPGCGDRLRCGATRSQRGICKVCSVSGLSWPPLS